MGEITKGFISFGKFQDSSNIFSSFLAPIAIFLTGIIVDSHKYSFMEKTMPDIEDIAVYSIGTAARMTGVSVHTLRMYEREGLIIPVKSPGNQRLYSQSDIERIQCIRAAITEAKISIAGIKHIQAMIPCWQIINCPAEQRNACEAYKNSSAGCWTYKHKKNVCSKIECRQCVVYQKASNCSGVKELMKSVTSARMVLASSKR